MCSHFAAELVNKMVMYRKPLAAISLCTDIAVITSIANDMGYEYVFSRQIQAIGQKGDCLVVLTTSGKSKNIMYAIKTARGLGIEVIQFPTKDELDMDTPHTQQKHLELIHELSTQIEQAFI